MSGWSSEARSHALYGVRDQLSVANGVLMYASRLVIPHQMRYQILSRLHDDGHFGISKCRDRAKSSVWWPDMNSDLKEYLMCCQFCQTHAPAHRKEPLIPTPSPDRPWSHVASDICQHGAHNYLVTVDIFSRFIEVQKLGSITSGNAIEKLKCLFARYGIPDLVTTDGGRQFVSQEFREFAAEYGFCHRVTDPYCPQANGAAERAVRQAKWCLEQRDPYLALMGYRATPVESTGLAPAQLLMGRPLQTRLPSPPTPVREMWRETSMRDAESKMQMKAKFDRHHGAKPLTELRSGERVRIRTSNDADWGVIGRVVGQRAGGRSYVIATDRSQYVRNRRHLARAPEMLTHLSRPIEEHTRDL